MPDGLMLSDSLAKKVEECKAELGFTDEISDAEFLQVAKHALAKYPECVDPNNAADLLFQTIANG